MESLVEELARLLETATSNSLRPAERRRWMAAQETALLRVQLALTPDMPESEDPV